MTPLVSILIPAFNAEGTIAETLRSAVRQTWPRKEIIVVDDGSTDGTRSVVEQFTEHGVRLVTQDNAGAAAARNKAFSVSGGDYVQWLDADDLLTENKIASQLLAVDPGESAKTILSGPWAYFFARAWRAQFVSSELWCDLTPLEWLLRKMEQNLFMQTATWLVPRAITTPAGPWNTELLGDDDGEYFCRVLLLCDRIRFVPEAKVFYRRSGASSLSYIGTSDRKMAAQMRSMRLHIQYIRSLEDSPRVRMACVKYLQTWLINFYPERLDLVEQATALARLLGGELRQPDFSWKYRGLAMACGPGVAKSAQVVLPRIRWSLVARWDSLLYRLQSRTASP